MKSFEIQTLRDGKWAIDSLFNDRDLAVFEARRVDESRRYLGVRVIEEVYDEQSGLTTYRTIFRGTRSRLRKNPARPAAAVHPAAAPASREGIGRERTPRFRARHREPRKPNVLVPVLVILLLLFMGLTGLLGLQMLSGSIG